MNDPQQTPANINPEVTYQLIRGFGAANILPWRPDMTAEQVNLAFGNADGQLGFSILRLRVPSDTSEFAMQVSTAKLASSLGAIIFASPWSPPAALKNNNNIIGGMLPSGSFTAYAHHLKSFTDYMNSNVVPLYAISIQNEPDANVNYESCSWNQGQMRNFMKNHAGSIGTRIIMPESLRFNHTFADTTLNDPAAAANVSIIGGHIYGSDPVDYPLAETLGKELWMTEHLDLDTTWEGALRTGKEINDCMNAGMNAYVWWYIVRFYGPILEDGTVSKRGYVMSQFARFIRPGYLRIEVNSNPQANVFLSAYKSGSKIIIVAINLGSRTEQQFTIQNGNHQNITPYVTSSDKDCLRQASIIISQNNFAAELEAYSITTFVSEP